MTFYCLRLSLGLLILGAVCVSMGHEESERATHVGKKPQVVRCSQFASGKTPSNTYVTLTRFAPCRGGCVTEEGRYGVGWRKVQIPVYPQDRRSEPAGKALRVILTLYNVKNEQDLVARLRKPRLTGVVWSRGDKLHRTTRKLLRESYPGIDLARCNVINVGGRVPTAASAGHIRWVGFGLIAAGLVVAGVWLFHRSLDMPGRKAAALENSEQPPPAATYDGEPF